MADSTKAVAIPKAQERVTIHGVPTDILILKFANATQIWITQLDRAGTVIEVAPLSVDASPVFDIQYLLGQRTEIGLDVLAKQLGLLLHKQGLVGAGKPMCLTCSLKSFDQDTIKELLAHVARLASGL